VDRGTQKGTVFKMNTDDYQTLIDQRISDLAALHAHGNPIDAAMCVAGINEGKPPIGKLREYCINMLKIKAKDFDRALQRHITEAKMGGKYPETATQLIHFFVQDHGISAQYNGLLTMRAKPYVEVGGEREYFEPDQRPDLASVVSTHFWRTIDFTDAQRDIRVVAAELGLPFKDTVINDASRSWYDFVKRDRLQHIMNLVSHEKMDDAGKKKVWQKLTSLVEKCFDLSMHTAEFVVTVFRKYMHQVKRKMCGLPIERHLMPIIMGGQQGSGKTTLVRQFIGIDKVKGHAMKELAKESDFKLIGDDRVIDLWRNFILFVDEMAWSTKAEMSTIKYITSADSMDRRRMQQNHTDNVAQNATMIGTSNKGSIAELFYDVTGLRRFVGLYALNQMDWDAINDMDWLELWRCVSPYEDDPILAILDDLKKMQEAERPKSAVECWLEHTDWYTDFSALRERNPRKFDAHELYDKYRLYEDKYFPQQNTNSIVFGRELGRLSRLDTPKPYFKRASNAKGTCWQWARDPVERAKLEHEDDPILEKVVDMMTRKAR
jgi:hypothetical protein